MQRRHFIKTAGTGTVVGLTTLAAANVVATEMAHPMGGKRNTAQEQANKAVVGQWFENFWGKTFTPKIISELAAPDMLLQYSLHAPRRGHADILAFMEDFRAAFPNLNFAGTAPLVAEGDLVVGQWLGGGTHTGSAFSDFLIGSLPAATGRTMRFSGTTVLRVVKGKIVEEIGIDDGLTALQQLGLLKKRQS